MPGSEEDPQVARVLRDLAPAEFPFFLQPLEVGPDHLHQLQNDGSRDVGHDAQRENRQAAEVAAAEEVDDAQHGALILLEKLRQNVRVDSRGGQERAQAVHPQHRQREQETLAQVRNPEHVGERFKKLVHDKISALPPARVIFSSADLLNLCACTVSEFFSSPSPKTLISARTWRMSPEPISSSGVTVVPAGKMSSDSTFTTAYSMRVGL